MSAKEKKLIPPPVYFFAGAIGVGAITLVRERFKKIPLIEVTEYGPLHRPETRTERQVRELLDKET